MAADPQNPEIDPRAAETVAILQARVDSLPPGAERAGFLRQLAATYLEGQGAPELSFLAATRALKDDPEAQGAIELAVQGGYRSGSMEELADLLEEISARVREPVAFRALHWALAQLYQGPLQSLSRAIAEWRRVIEQSPEDQEAFEQLSALYLANNDVASLLEMLRRQLAVSEDIATRQRLLHRIGEIQLEHQHDLAQAFATYRRLLELVPEDDAALTRLDDLCQQQQRWPELSQILETELRIALARGDTAAAATFLERLGDLREGTLRDTDGAVEAYRRLLELVPDNARSEAPFLSGAPWGAKAVERLEAILAAKPQQPGLAEFLEGLHRNSQNWAKTASALEARASAMADPQARRPVWLELSKVNEQRLQRPDLAFIAMARAFRDDPSDPAVCAELERLADLSESLEELVGIYEEELDSQTRAEVLASLQARLGVILSERFNDQVKALDHLERAREYDLDAAAPGLPILERLYRENGSFEKLAAVLDEMAQRATDPTERVSLLFRLGQLSEERLGAVDRAAVAYETLLQVDPNHLPALRSLEKLYETAGRSHDLFAILERERQLTPEGQGRDRLTARLAEVASAQLGDDERAIQIWGELLQKNPRADNALNGLERALERRGRWEDLAEFLKQRLKATVDPREIARLHEKLGGVLGTHLEDTEEAIRSFEVVLERDPRNRSALEALRTIYEKPGQAEQLVSVLRRLIPLQEDAAGVKGVRLQLAEVLSELGRREEAVEAARRALDLEPHQIDELQRAEALFTKLNAFPDLARAMEARAAAYPESQRAEAIETYFGVAELYEVAIKKPEGGSPALERVFELDPGNARAFESLKRIYQRTQDYRRYCALLEKIADQAATEGRDPAIRVQILAELAVIQEQKLGQKELAFLALCRAFQADPLHATAKDFRRLAKETEALEELEEVYHSVADQLGDAPELEHILLELAEIQDQDLDNPQRAEESLRRLLSVMPGNERALDALADLFSRRGRTREYVVALEQKVEQVSGIGEKKQVLSQLAKAYDEQLGEPDEAALTLRRGLELDPGDRTLIGELAKLLRREKAFPELVSLLQRAREIVNEPEQRSELQQQIAEITEVELNDPGAALSAYQLALELDPKSLSALQALERIYTKLDRPSELLRVFDRQLEILPTGERAKVLFKAAQVWEEKLQNTPNAVACLEGVLAVDPHNTIALSELARLYRAQEDYERLALTYQRHITAVKEGKRGHEELLTLHVALGGVYHAHLNRSQEAEELYLSGLEIDPTSQSALRALGELYESQQHWPQALEMIRRESRLAATAKDAVLLHTRAGRIHEEQLGDTDEAINAYRRALEIDPTALPPLQALKRIYAARKEWDLFADVARQEAAVLPLGEEKTERLVELGHFYQETREDPRSAERFYKEALEVTDGHLPAALPLVDIYVAASHWAEAEQLLDVVVERLEGVGDAGELCRQYYRLGYVADKLEHEQQALIAYRRAYELDATYLPALEGLGHLLVRLDQLEEALKIFQAILIHHRDELTDLEVIEIYWQIGEIHRGLGQNERAQKNFEKAVEIDSGHEPSRKALAEILETAGNYEGAVAHRQKLLETLDGDPRFEAAMQVARLSRDRLGDSYQAIDAFELALKTQPDSLEALDDLLALYRATKQGQKAVDVIQRMLDHPKVQADPRARRDLHFQLGVLLRDDLKDPDRAIRHFNFALDADHTFAEAFSALETLFGEKQDWVGLEHAYHAMLKRLPKTPETQGARLALWRSLGELYQKVLKNSEGALVAYEVIAKAEPDNGEVAELLADLYAQIPGKEREAIEASRLALRHTSDPVKVSKALVRLHASLKDYDRAFVAAQVVVNLLGERSPDEEQIINRLKKFTKEQASRPLSDRLWSEFLYHERLKGPMAEILALCQEATGGIFAVELAKLNVNKKKDRVDVQTSMLFFANMFKYVSRTLAMENLELYKVLGQTGLVVGNTFPVSFLAGEEMFKDRPKRELWFAIAKAMAFSRPELAMARLHPPDEVEALVQAAVSLAVPKFKVTADKHLVAGLQEKIASSMSDAVRPTLFRAAREAAADPQSLEVRPFLEAVEHTANRVGVLLCGDVEVGMRCLSQETGVAVKLPLRSKVRDLMLFCMSDAYSKLRNALGIAVEVKAEGRASA